MSRKAQQFANIITQPLNVFNYIVDIPGVAYGILISSTTMPSEKLGIIEKWFQGEPLRYPTKPVTDGLWKFTIPESDDGKVRRELDKLKSNVHSQLDGTMKLTQIWKDVKITLRDLADNHVCSVILHGAWLRGREPLPLNNNDVQKSVDWEYEFVYQWVEDVDDINAGTQVQFTGK